MFFFVQMSGCGLIKVFWITPTGNPECQSPSLAWTSTLTVDSGAQPVAIDTSPISAKHQKVGFVLLMFYFYEKNQQLD